MLGVNAGQAFALTTARETSCKQRTCCWVLYQATPVLFVEGLRRLLVRNLMTEKTCHAAASGGLNPQIKAETSEH